MHGQKQLFEFMLARIKKVATESGLKPPQAFGKWFANIYFSDPHQFLEFEVKLEFPPASLAEQGTRDRAPIEAAATDFKWRRVSTS